MDSITFEGLLDFSDGNDVLEVIRHSKTELAGIVAFIEMICRHDSPHVVYHFVYQT